MNRFPGKGKDTKPNLQEGDRVLSARLRIDGNRLKGLFTVKFEFQSASANIRQASFSKSA